MIHQTPPTQSLPPKLQSNSPWWKLSVGKYLAYDNTGSSTLITRNQRTDQWTIAFREVCLLLRGRERRKQSSSWYSLFMVIDLDLSHTHTHVCTRNGKTCWLTRAYNNAKTDASVKHTHGETTGITDSPVNGTAEMNKKVRNAKVRGAKASVSE